jgi:hypothetical protein
MKILYPLHSLTRRNIALMEHLIAAVGLSLLLYALMRTVPVYPLYWDEVIAAAILVLTVISPVAGYFAAIVAATYPLYSVSLYLAVLFLAIAIIGQHIFINNLGATLLTFSSPLLGSIYLAWGIPLLGGLWWGPAGGALMGAVAALWGLLVAGMAGLTPDWLNLYGVLPILGHLPERFAQAGSLEAIGLLFLPLAPDSTYLLYCLLQIGSWSFVGWAAGMLSEKDWVLYQRPRSSMIIVLIGSSVLAVLQILLSVWLGMPISSGAEFALGLTTLCSALAVMLIEFGEDFFEHPLPIPNTARAIHFEPPVSSVVQNSTPAAAPTASSETPKVQEKRKSDEEDDLIMLELD